MAGATLPKSPWIGGLSDAIDACECPYCKVGGSSEGEVGDMSNLLGVGAPPSKERLLVDFPSSRVGSVIRTSAEGFLAKPETSPIEVEAYPGTKTPAARGS